MNLKNSETSKSLVLMLNFTEKIDLRGEKVLLYQILVFTIQWKTWKAHIITINWECQLQ